MQELTYGPLTEAASETEVKGLYKIAVGFSDAVAVAADSLAFLAKFGAFMGPGEREQMNQLQGKLNQACDFEF